MKEATGELSTTVIAIVAIAAILAIFTAFLLPTLRSSITSKMHCTDAYNCRDCENGRCTCSYDDEDGNEATVRCTDPNSETNTD